MAFGTATVITKLGFSIIANRIQTTPTINAPKFVAIGTGATGAARTAVNTDTALEHRDRDSGNRHRIAGHDYRNRRYVSGCRCHYS
jgi:hypothetical protein